MDAWFYNLWAIHYSYRGDSTCNTYFSDLNQGVRGYLVFEGRVILFTLKLPF